jgi:hypothetical protein
MAIGMACMITLAEPFAEPLAEPLAENVFDGM